MLRKMTYDLRTYSPRPEPEPMMQNPANVQVQLPAGMQMPPGNVMRPAAQNNQLPNLIRDLLQRMQPQPTPAGGQPPAPPQRKAVKSVLKQR